MENKDIEIIEQYITSSFRITLPENVLFSLEKLLKEYKIQNKIINEMAKCMVQEFAEYQLDEIYEKLYNCNGLERNWTRGDEEEIKDILKYFRKSVSNEFI